MRKILLGAVMMFVCSSIFSAHYAFAEWPETEKEKAIAQVGRLYQDHCMTCHGVYGKGDGNMARMLNMKPLPRDFTSYEDMRGVTELAIIEAIMNGKKAEPMPMPAFKQLKEEEIQALAVYVKNFLGAEQYKLEICADEYFTFDTGLDATEGPLTIEIGSDENSQRWLRVEQDERNPSVLHIFTPDPFRLKSEMWFLKHNKKRAIRTHFALLGKFSEKHGGPEPLITMTVRFNFPACGFGGPLGKERPESAW